jgi:mRNA interferase HigB
VHIVTLGHLNAAARKHPGAAEEIGAWVGIVKSLRWTSSVEVRRVFPDADAMDGYVIFNVRRNRYRMVTVIHYARDRQGVPTMGHIYIRSFLTHKQYDNRAHWDKE